MENKFSLNEVDDFIRKFKNKNKNIKKNAQVIQNEPEFEKKIDQSNCVSENKMTQSTVKGNLFKENNLNEHQDIFDSNKKENNDVNDLFTSDPSITQPKSQSQSLSQSQSQFQFQSQSQSQSQILSQFVKQTIDSLYDSTISIPKANDIDNKINSDANNSIYSSGSNIEEIPPKTHIHSTEKSITVTQETKSIISNDKLNQKKKVVNTQSTPVSNKSTSVIVVNKNPFADDPDEDPSSLFESREEITSMTYTAPIKSNKIKVIVPQTIINQNKQPQADKENISKLIVEENKNDNSSNKDLRDNEIPLSKEESIKKSTDNKLPHFKDKTYQKSSQYAKPPIYHQQKTNIPLYPQIQNTSNYNNNNEKESSMKTIYTNFSNELNAKAEIFQSDIINKEIERLDDDEINDAKENPSFRTNSIDYSHNQRETAIEDTPVFLLDSDRTMPSSSYSNMQITNTSLSNGNIITTLTSKILISPLLPTLLSNKEKELYMNYSPISYSEQFNFSKSIEYLETLLSITSKNNITSSIAIYLELLLLRNRMKLSSCNLFLETNTSIRNELIQMIKARMNYASYTKDFFDFKIAIPQDEYQDSSMSLSYSNPESTMDHMREYCYANNSMASLVLFSIISNQEGINDYLISMFDKGFINKNSYWYLFVIVKSGQIDKLLEEDSSILFDNFAYFVLMLLENWTLINNINKIIDALLKSNDSRLTYLHYIILFFLRNSFSIEEEPLHGKLINSFLNLCNIQKIILCDVFNYFCYCLNKNLPKVIAKSSILIKFKYTLIKLYDNDSSVIALCKKINENYVQFGEIGRNKYFKDYLMNSYVNSTNAIGSINANDQYEDNKSKGKYNDQSNQQFKDDDPENNKKYQTLINEPSPTLITSNNNTNVNDNSNSNTNTNKSDIFGGGIVSSLFSTLGLGLSQKQNIDNQNQGPKTYTKEELSQLPPEVSWKIEHPNEEEIYYDKEKKRYVLRGQIYDDQDEVIQQKEKEKPFVPPPKFSKTNISQSTTYTNTNENITKDQSDYQQSLYNTPQSKLQPPTISNPFNSLKPPARANNANKKNIKQKALTNRYAVGYQQ